MEIDKEQIEEIVKLYFAGYSVEEAIGISIINKNIKLEDKERSLGWEYQQLRYIV